MYPCYYLRHRPSGHLTAPSCTDTVKFHTTFIGQLAPIPTVASPCADVVALSALLLKDGKGVPIVTKCTYCITFDFVINSRQLVMQKNSTEAIVQNIHINFMINWSKIVNTRIGGSKKMLRFTQLIYFIVTPPAQPHGVLSLLIL